MDFSNYGGLSRYDDGDHAIDLRNPHFRREQPSFLHGQSHFQQQSNHYAHGLSNLAVDVKPRLTKEQHDILESHYQQQNKPNTQTKKGFAETLGVSLDKVNVSTAVYLTASSVHSYCDRTGSRTGEPSPSKTPRSRLGALMLPSIAVNRINMP